MAFASCCTKPQTAPDGGTVRFAQDEGRSRNVAADRVLQFPIADSVLKVRHVDPSCAPPISAVPARSHLSFERFTGPAVYGCVKVEPTVLQAAVIPACLRIRALVLDFAAHSPGDRRAGGGNQGRGVILAECRFRG